MYGVCMKGSFIRMEEDVYYNNLYLVNIEGNDIQSLSNVYLGCNDAAG